ncbi:MAG: aminodeoxychorismate synthase component I [Desulfitobacteriaceae bacterium]
MIFILDNFDSFTYNLFQYFKELGEEVIVRRKDICTLPDLDGLNPELIVISPGPCSPAEAPLSLEVIQHFMGRIPILGICLGHQAIGHVFGGKVVRAKVPVHGKTSLIKHDGHGVFLNLANPLLVTRYHSLAIERSSLPDDLIITAEAADGEIMGFRHKTLPIESVQFHPEAILTQEGHELLSNAISNARKWQSSIISPWQTRSIALPVSPHLLFGAFKQAAAPFFLDSGEQYFDLGRYSYMGADPFLEASASADKVELSWSESSHSESHSTKETNSLQVLDNLRAKYQVTTAAPFPFAGGAVGFFSYDLKDELEALPQLAKDDLALPYWRLAWYDGIVIFDHLERIYWLTACGMMDDGECSEALANKRLNKLEELLNAYTLTLSKSSNTLACESFEIKSTKIMSSVNRAKYLDDIQLVIDYIKAGDIYQANLTQRFFLSWEGDPWVLYQQLHELNPAPFAAFLPYPDFQILCSSPERFIRIQRDGAIETRPIKGTRPRGSSSSTEDQALALELQNSAKDNAELTMIIDLERNDLGRICKIGSVKVPNLIHLEKYPTVWHLVSTITGQLKTPLLPSEILRAVFPGGSITGAPKIRAMEIIEELEPYKRGIYTGSIGYLGFDGAWDLNIVIRTILLKDGKAYLHAGGGIVVDSQPDEEYKETLVKAQALFSVLGGKLDE